MNDGGRDMPGHRPAVAPTTTDTGSVARAQATDVGDLLTTWVGIQMDTVDALVADAQAKVDAIPDLRTLMLLVGELVVRLHWLETEVQRLKGGQP